VSLLFHLRGVARSSWRGGRDWTAPAMSTQQQNQSQCASSRWYSTSNECSHFDMLFIDLLRLHYVKQNTSIHFEAFLARYFEIVSNIISDFEWIGRINYFNLVRSVAPILRTELVDMALGSHVWPRAFRIVSLPIRMASYEVWVKQRLGWLTGYFSLGYWNSQN
jgi:hypothetical protein